jgi:hypothetical protein
MFREAWTSKWSTPADYERLLDDYAVVLEKLTVTEIRNGLDRTLGRQFPPSPSEFFALARERDRTHGSHRRFRALPRPPRDPEDVRARIADVRKALTRQEAS